MSSRVVAQTLGLAGLAPFFIAATLAFFNMSLLGQDPTWVFLAYSAIILSFLGGILWGRCLKTEATAPVSGLFVVSNLVALGAWAALLGWPNFAGLVLGLLILGYVLMLGVDFAYTQSLPTDMDYQYLWLRFMLTALVVILHIAIWLLIDS